MSRKNHKIVDGRLLQTDKRFSALKGKQQEKICLWLKTEYLKAIEGRTVPLSKTQKDAIASAVYEKIKEAGIWISYYEVRNYFSRKLPGWNRKYLTQRGSTAEVNRNGSKTGSQGSDTDTAPPDRPPGSGLPGGPAPELEGV